MKLPGNLGEFQLQALVQGLPVVIWALDSEGTVVLCDGRGFERLGVQPEHWIGQSAFELFHDAPGKLESIRKVLAGKPCKDTSRVKGVAWFETHYTPIKDADGKVVGAAGFSVDVTEEVQNQQQLEVVQEAVTAKTGEDFFHTLVERLCQALDADLVLIGSLTGSTPETVETLAVANRDGPVENFHYPLQGSPCEQVLRDQVCLFDKGAAEAFPLDVMLSEQGIEAYAGAALKDTEGVPVGILVALYRRPLKQDSRVLSLMEVFAARAAVELSRLKIEGERHRLAQAVEQSPSSVVITDTSGAIQYVNQAFIQRTGYQPEEVLGQTPRILKSGLTPDETYQDLWQTILDGRPWRGELVNRTKSGELIHEDQVVAPIRDQNGRISHFVATKQDVSELRRSQERLQRLNRTLTTLSECNQALVRATSEQQLLDSICALLVEHGGYPFVWIGYANDQHPQGVSIEASAGQIAEDLDVWSRTLLGCGVPRQAIDKREIIVCGKGCGCPLHEATDSEEACSFEGGVITLPILRQGLDQGVVLQIASDRDEAFDDEEQTLLRELADDLGFGIANHRMRESLAESETKFRSLAEESLVGVYMIQDGRMVYANPKMSEIFGYSRQELTGGVTVSDLVVPEDRELVRGNLQRRLEGRVDSMHYSFRGLHRSGREIQVEVYGVRTQHEGTPAVVGTLLDITERERALEQVRLMGQAVESSINGIAISDVSLPDKPFVYVNAAFESITGYSADEAVGNNGRFLLGQEREQEELGRLVLALRQGESTKVVLRNYRKDGSLFWNELTVAPIRDASGKVTHTVSVLHDITEQKRYEQQLQKLVNQDELTGLANRNLLFDRLAQSLIHAERNDRKVALVVLNLDRFRLLHQSLGRAGSDEVLKTIALRLQGVVRQGDTVARFGGDEFALVLADMANLEDIFPVLARLQQLINQSLVVHGESVAVTASIGVAIYPRDGDSVELMVRNSQAAMFQAMEQRNCFRFYQPQMNAHIQERLGMESALRRAIERDEFVLYYQPKIDLRSGQVTGAEALIRWNDPAHGLVPPLQFIPLAEEIGLIGEIGRWALRQACRDAADWLAEGHEIQVAVNFSAQQFADPLLCQQVSEALAATRLPPRLLECELTESMLMHEPDEALLVLNELHELGVAIALDDFGTGYSSLSYLKRFPIDTLKIDREFVRDIPEDAQDMAICRAIIAMARTLNLHVVAEGVETQIQTAFLRAEGCQSVQGFYFSRPLPEAEFRAQLASRPLVGG